MTQSLSLSYCSYSPPLSLSPSRCDASPAFRSGVSLLSMRVASLLLLPLSPLSLTLSLFVSPSSYRARSDPVSSLTLVARTHRSHCFSTIPPYSCSRSHAMHGEHRYTLSYLSFVLGHTARRTRDPYISDLIFPTKAYHTRGLVRITPARVQLCASVSVE